MPITYFTDSRDAKQYRCVRMPGGKLWSAENLTWAGAGYFYNNDPVLGAIHGRLYTLLEAQSAIPPGTHLPTASERDAMLAAIPNDDGLALKSASLWTYPQNGNGNDLYGFSAIPSGSAMGSIGPDGPVLGNFLNINYIGNIWCATVSDGYFAMSSTSNDVGIGSFPGSTYWLSVRFIVDEPPPTKINGTFSGSGVRVFMSIKSLGVTLEVAIVSQTTTSLVIDPAFVITWGKQSGPVQIMVVDGEYISDWIDWEFK